MKDIFDLNNNVTVGNSYLFLICEQPKGQDPLILSLNLRAINYEEEKKMTLKLIGERELNTLIDDNEKWIDKYKFLLVDLENDEMFICRDIKKNIWNKWANILGV